MLTMSTGILSIVFYTMAWFLLLTKIKYRPDFKARWYIPAVFALVLHAYFLYLTIDKAHVQNLDWANLFSMTIWLAGASIIILSGIKRVQNLVLLIFPLAVVLIIMQYCSSGNANINTAASAMLLIHILLSIMAMAAVVLALAQALILAIQNYLLRRQVNFRWLMLLPAIDAMEDLLFNFIMLGFILLSLSLLSATWLLHQNNWFFLLPKIIMSLLAWVVFGLLLWGRHKFGWHGKIAIRCTLAGFFILVLVYLWYSLGLS